MGPSPHHLSPVLAPPPPQGRIIRSLICEPKHISHETPQCLKVSYTLPSAAMPWQLPQGLPLPSFIHSTNSQWAATVGQALFYELWLVKQTRFLPLGGWVRRKKTINYQTTRVIIYCGGSSVKQGDMLASYWAATHFGQKGQTTWVKQ